MISTASSIDQSGSFALITATDVIQHVFCARFTYYMHCLNIPQREGSRYKVLKGRAIHFHKERSNPEYLRQRLNCIHREIAVSMSSRELKITGIVDEVLHLDDGTLAPLDYKYALADDFIHKTHVVQSIIYALLIMENYKKTVSRGFVCFIRGGVDMKEIVYTNNDFIYVKGLISEIFEILRKGYYPGKTESANRCADCCYRNICIEV